MAQTDITKTSQSRVFMTLSAGSPKVAPAYQTCLVLGGVSQSFGDREPIYCQDPYTIGKFVTVGMTESPAESVESSLNGRFSSTARSTLIRAAQAQAPVDVHVHVGAVGSNPTIFNQYRMKIVFEGARFSSVDIDELGSHEEDSPVGHSVDFTADNWYQLVPLVFSERGAAQTAQEITAAWLHYNGDLAKPPKERIVALAVSKAGTGVKADFYYSIDAGTTWYATTIDSLATEKDASGVAVIGEYVVVTSSEVASMAYMLLSALDGVVVPDFTEVTTGFVAAKFPNALYSIGSVGFLACEDGYVYKTTNPAGGVTTMSAGAATSEDLLAIHALDETTIVAVGEANAVIVCRDGENFTAVTGPAVGVNLTSVCCLTDRVYLVGTADGKLWYTDNAGSSWTEKSFPSSGSGVVNSIRFSTRLVGYLSHTLSGAGRLLQTTDGGYSWTLVPTAGLASITDKLAAVAVTAADVNLVMAAGLDNGGTVGTVIIGEPTE